MAYNSTSHRPTGISRLFSGFGQSLTAAVDARMHKIEQLNALSDAELSAKGLRRSDINRYVFRDVIGL